MHTPQKLADSVAARKRFAFEEVFMIQLERGQERENSRTKKVLPIDAPPKEVAEFVSHFPFTPTKAQSRVIEIILRDMRGIAENGSARGVSYVSSPRGRRGQRQNGRGGHGRICRGAHATQAKSLPLRRQVPCRWPTWLRPKFWPNNILSLLYNILSTSPSTSGSSPARAVTSSPPKVARSKATTISRAQLLKWVANGEIPVVIGTHALIQKSVQFKHLALVIIDEQHRFGVNQRKALTKKKKAEQIPAGHLGSSQRVRHEFAPLPHLLSMTATPIPRTLALTVYGDLDLTLLDQMPAGRKPIITEIIKPAERAKAYTQMREQLAEGRQAYVICPRIEEPDPDKAFAIMAKSVTAEASALKKDIFPEYAIAILHSKMTPKEKDETMQKFSNHEIDILVATSVVEVGVNVQNATMIFIEGAERFGLAQLHQLRGRVVRSNHQAYCFVCPESRGESTLGAAQSAW